MIFTKMAHLLENIFYPVIRGVYKIGLGILLVMMFLTIVDVTGRKFFAAPITGSYELTEFLLALLVFCSIGYTQIQKGHIVTDALVSRFSPRTQAWIDSVVYAISLGVACLLTWQLAAQAKRLWSGQNVTGVLHLPIHPFVIAAAFGSLLFCLVLLVDFLNSLEKVRKP
ncbi:MAG: TRAP transporter small permease [Deltaproteobacteria bacterium]|nr:TRAP transporter small permease [Deltaproteobacteria bacterium]